MGYDMYAVRANKLHGDGTYHRANIWGMGMLRSVMSAANVLDWNAQHEPWGSFKEDDRKGQKQNARVRAFRSKDKNLVPGDKFCSNDGWIITPEECLLIANGLDRLLRNPKRITYTVYLDGTKILTKEEREYVQKFSNFCRRSALLGGFKVY